MVTAKNAIPIGCLCLAVLVVGTGMARGAITLTAIDRESVRMSNGTVYGDDMLRAYWDGTLRVDGFMKFDLSVIPDNATITSLTLTLFSNNNYFAPLNSPQLRVYRSTTDSWAGGGSGFPATLDETLTTLDSGPFPSVSGTPYSFALNTAAVNWSADLLDNKLTLVIQNDKPTYSYMYFQSGLINAAVNPTLTVEYSNAVPEPTSLSVWSLLGLSLGGAGWWRRRNR